MNRHITAVAGVLTMIAVSAPAVQADGGSVQISERCGAYLITVFTSPTPLRAGPVDVSVLVQDAVSKRIRVDLPVRVTACRDGQYPSRVSCPATPEAATNKLFCAALIDLAEPGLWHLQVEVTGDGAPVVVNGNLVVAEPLPPWLDLSLWIGWPAAAIGLFGLHRFLVWRRTTARAMP